MFLCCTVSQHVIFGIAMSMINESTAADSAEPGPTARTPRELIKRLGGPTKVAVALGLKQAAVSNWDNRGIPAKWLPKIRALAASLSVELAERDLESAINWG